MASPKMELSVVGYNNKEGWEGKCPCVYLDELCVLSPVTGHDYCMLSTTVLVHSITLAVPN